MAEEVIFNPEPKLSQVNNLTWFGVLREHWRTILTNSLILISSWAAYLAEDYYMLLFWIFWYSIIITGERIFTIRTFRLMDNMIEQVKELNNEKRK